MTTRKLIYTLLVSAIPLSVSLAAAPQSNDPNRPFLETNKGVELSGRQLPVGIRLSNFMDFLADKARRDEEGGTYKAKNFLERLGLDPDSPAATELIESALLARRSIPPFDLSSALALGPDEEALAAFHLEDNKARHRIFGEAFGAWLRDRDAEGADIALLIKQIIDSPHWTTGIATGGDGPFDFEGLLAENKAFQAGLRTTLGHVPEVISGRQSGERQ